MTDQQNSDRVTHLEGRVTSVEGALGDVKTTQQRHAQELLDVRIGMERLHADLRVNNESTRRIDANVSKVVQDTSEMLATYKATPRMREDTRWWVWVISSIAGLVITVSTFYAAFIRGG